MRRVAPITIVVAALPATAVAADARAAGEGVQGIDDDHTVSKTDVAAFAGSFLAFSQAASLESRRASVVAFGGYDSARRPGNFEAATEVRLWGPVAVRGGAVYTNWNKTVRPWFGARVQALREARHGVDASVGVFYRPDGLTEPEGEIESVVSVGRHIGAVYLLGNALYGQDPDGRERDGEVRMAVLRPFASRWILGFDSRLRFDLGSDQRILAQHKESTWDLVAGPSGTALLGQLALSLQTGGSGLRVQQRNSYGIFALVGVGAAF